MIILQIAPVIGVGTGVGAVAYHLEQEWKRLGHDVRRLELDDTGGSWLPDPGPGWKGKLALMARVVWFSTVGTVVAWRRIADLPPGSVSICHNDALAGDIYINHGIVTAAMRARGKTAWRMARNPLHLFTYARDLARYRSSAHRVVVNLSASEDRELRRTYGRIRPDTVVIHNGVQALSEMSSCEEREEIRRDWGLPQRGYVCAFVGHEFARKGLDILAQAVSSVEGVTLFVIGGAKTEISRFVAGTQPGVRKRLVFTGKADDARRLLAAADVLALPSAYEANALALLEAFAAGVPVIATRVGAAEELIVDGVNGYLVDRNAAAVAEALRTARDLDRGALRKGAMTSARQQDWSRIAEIYLELFQTLVQRR